MGPQGLPTSPPEPFQKAAKAALEDTQLRRNMGKATQTIRAKRAKVVGELSDWEALREAGRAIKDGMIRHLDQYLLTLEAAVTAAGGTVHWARDGAEANHIIAEIATRHGAREVIKVKSLTTDEIGLNDALKAVGIDAFETDLAELDHPACGRAVLAHSRAGDPQEPRRDPPDLHAAYGSEGAFGQSARPGRGGADLSAAEVPECAGGDQRRRISPWPRRAPSASSSPKATAACA